MTDKHPGLKGAELLYAGRTLLIQALVNTDEPMKDVVARIAAAAAGPNEAMATTVGSELKTAEAKVLWQTIWNDAVAAKKAKAEEA